MSESITLKHIRRMLAALLAVGLTGIAVELWLLGHIEEWRQIVPLVVIGLTLALLVWENLAPTRLVVQLLRVVMLALIVSGGLGVWFHYAGNLEFQMEMDPTQQGLALLLKILHAKTPPALAPGVMAQLGVLGLVYTYKHPFLTQETR
ncbi:MAG: hypothetical protein KAY59_08190 [Acidobacteria bacterium]|nr:hypothetical protein [Acidobacteriota bacterium]